MVRVELSEGGKVVPFSVDREWSYIGAKVLADQPDALSLYLMIDCHETAVQFSPEEKAAYGTDEDGDTVHCSLELMGLTVPVRGWRDLAGRSVEIAYDPGQVHPILPDGPGTFYFDARHHVPNQNRVRFGRREGCWFELDWGFRATAYPDDPGMRVAVNTRLVLRQLEVLLPEEDAFDVEAARRLALRFAAVADLGGPERVGDWWVWPLIEAAA